MINRRSFFRGMAGAAAAAPALALAKAPGDPLQIPGDPAPELSQTGYLRLPPSPPDPLAWARDTLRAITVRAASQIEDAIMSAMPGCVVDKEYIPTLPGDTVLFPNFLSDANVRARMEGLDFTLEGRDFVRRPEEFGMHARALDSLKRHSRYLFGSSRFRKLVSRPEPRMIDGIGCIFTDVETQSLFVRGVLGYDPGTLSQVVSVGVLIGYAREDRATNPARPIQKDTFGSYYPQGLPDDGSPAYWPTPRD